MGRLGQVGEIKLLKRGAVVDALVDDSGSDASVWIEFGDPPVRQTKPVVRVCDPVGDLGVVLAADRRGLKELFVVEVVATIGGERVDTPRGWRCGDTVWVD